MCADDHGGCPSFPSPLSSAGCFVHYACPPSHRSDRCCPGRKAAPHCNRGRKMPCLVESAMGILFARRVLFQSPYRPPAPVWHRAKTLLFLQGKSQLSTKPAYRVGTIDTYYKRLLFRGYIYASSPG